MKEEGLKNVRRRCKYRSYKGEVGKTAPNRIKRNFNTKAPNRKWTTDVTQINIGMDKCYLSPILDMYNGEIVSYTISDHPDLKMVMDMLEKAFVAREVGVGLMLHSDQGWHYQHRSYQKSLQDHKIVQSMSRKGNCLDNAMMENFFGIMKSELLEYVPRHGTLQTGIEEIYQLLQQRPDKTAPKRNEPGTIPDSLRCFILTLNCPTFGGQFTIGCGLILFIDELS